MSAEETLIERTIGDWTSYQDDEGRVYYYNSVTEESSWDPPPGFEDEVIPADENVAAADSGVEHAAPATPGDDGITKSPSIHGDGITQSPTFEDQFQGEDNVADGEEIGDGWIAYKDDEGRTYYYNAESGETQWEKPDIASKAEAIDGSKGDEGEYMDASPTVSDREDEDEAVDTSDKKAEDNKDDPAALAENFLKEPDAVMESQVLDHISTLVSEIGPQEAGRKAMQSLMTGYQGDTAICGLMALWLAELKASNERNDNDKSNTPPSTLGGGESMRDKRFHQGANAARDVVEEVVNRLAKERFTKDGGDAIMKLSKKQVAFVDKMIESERWRNLLIDLSATNTDTKLFMYCLQSISNKGHHRAIANRINQSDYFGVLNSMLSAELILLGKIAVDGYSKRVFQSIDTSKGRMGTLIADLRRTCSSTSYTYLYTNELLNELISQAETQAKNVDTNNVDAINRAARKWRRMQEELEDEMLKAHNSGTTFQRKRRIDVTLAMGELVQRQRRRFNPTESAYNDTNGNGSSTSTAANNLDSAMATFLTKCCLGNPIDKESLENISKYAYSGSTDRIGDLLIKHPLAITFLLQNMFSTKRIRQLETRQKCARLVALAVIASERIVPLESTSNNASDEENLCHILLKGSQLCEQVEAMVSFTVLDKADASDRSVGRQLSAMCIKYSAIAEGALLWARDLASGPEFVTTAAYPTLSPCILSLARLICIYHPLSRPAVLEVAMIFMGHSNREISHQKMQSIKEQCLRLLVWLSTQGMVLGVISAVRGKLRKGSSEIDSALVRYLVSGFLEAIQSPFSIPFARAFGEMLMDRSCIDTLTSPLFEASKKKHLSDLIIQFEETFAVDSALDEGNKKLITALRSTYTITS